MSTQTGCQKTPYPLRFSVGALIHEIARLRRKLLDGALRPSGLTRSQRWMLIQLSQFTDGVSQADLAASMNVGAVSLGEKLGLMIALGYVARERSPMDRRQNIVRLTDEGYSALERSTQITRDFNADVLRGLSPATVEQVEAALKVVHRNLMMMDHGAVVDGSPLCDMNSSECE